MARYREKVKNDRLKVKVKLSSDEVIENREFDIIAKNNIRGFLKPKKGWNNRLEYTGPSGISLFEHLKKPITKYEFFYIMAQVIEATDKLRSHKLFLNNLVLDLRYVYINENTEEVHFIYLPIAGNHVKLNVVGFMEAIIYAAKPSETNNRDYMAKFINFLQSIKEFNAELLENYISKADLDVGKQIKKHRVGQSGFITDKREDYYEHYEKKRDEDEDTELLNEEDRDTGLLEDDDEPTGLLNEEHFFETEAIEDAGTDVLVDVDILHNAPTMTRVLTGEIFSINKPVFRLGKEKSYVDYFVTNNNAISRSHADVITRGNMYYVIDLNSTNHTYINGTILPVKVETEIRDGDILKLATEEFVFHV